MKAILRAALVTALVAVGPSCGSPDTQANDVSTQATEESIDFGGLGSIQTRNDRGETGKLRLESVRVEGKQAGDVAEVAVTHVFASDADVDLEGTFRFPMPDGAIVTGLAMMVDGKMMEGELVENEKARKIYQEIVDSMQDPALLEWEHGTTFKMRVFPIEAKRTKTVTMRYLVPLRKRGPHLAFVQGTRSIDDANVIAALDVQWQGRSVFSERNVARDRVIEAAASDAAVTLRETRADGVYSLVHVRPDWSQVPASSRPLPKNWVIVVDSSRSVLEERKLQLEALRALLAGLPAQAQFLMATSDLDTRTQAAFRSVTPAAVEEAVRFVEATPPDGATDVSAMLKAIGNVAANVDAAGVLYVGDCEASWGETSALRLAAQAKSALARSPFYPLLLGSSVDLDTARELAAATGGRVVRAHTLEDVHAFTGSLRGTPKRVVEAELVQVPGSVLLPAGKLTIEEGEDVVAYLRTEPQAMPPTALTLRSHVGATTLDTTLPIEPATTPFVARRFGAAWVHELERAGKAKDDIVQASLAFSVMSKHTSFLVLESEEAYERYAIERRAARANDPRVAGVDVLDATGAQINLDRIQPGDPEILIDAPADAVKVLVVLADGTIKIAHYEPEAKNGRGAWMVRFLVDRGTPEGRYEARAFIEYANGERDTRTVQYSVDTTEPRLDVRIERSRTRRGSYVVVAKQEGPPEAFDLRRVEAQMPDGQTLTFAAQRSGEYRAAWKPATPVPGGWAHVVGFDRALNHATVDVRVP